MYLPPHFDARDRAIACELMRAHPFASLISSDDDGLPFVTHLPLVLQQPQSKGTQPQPQPSGTTGQPAAAATEAAAQAATATAPSDLVLLGHVAKPNAHWRHLQARPRAVVTFLGPHAYLSPQVYPDLARVPSWNYLAVHATVEATLIDEPEAKDALLKALIGEHEPAYAQQWRDLGHDFQHKLLAGIVGFSLRVTVLQCKLKLNQHRRESHAALHARYAAGTPDERALAAWMPRLGMATR